MDDQQAVADRTATRESNLFSRKLPKKMPPTGRAKAPPTIHLDTTSSIISMPAASVLHAAQDPAVSSYSLENEGRNFTLEEILELGDDCLGLKVLLTAKQGSCLGVINIILTTCKKITLEKVSNPNTGKKKLGLQTFFFHDVLNIKVLGEDQEARQRLLKDIYFEKQQGKKLLRKKLLPIDLQEKYRDNMHVEEVLPGLIQQLAYEEASTEKPSSVFSDPPQGKLPRPSKWVIIDAVDDAYKKALSLICKEMVISVGMAGLQLGRSGTLVWLSVATSNIIFHFDVAKIGSSEVMDGGLRTVLQDGKVVKVVHDCRPMEDLLHHQLNLNLNNVFDTQVAEIYLHLLNNQGAVPLLVPTLPSMLAKYLSLASHHLFPDGQEYSKIDDSMWLERPLSKSLGDRLARDILYLRELRLEQLDVMLVDLRQITEVYLGAMRDKDSVTVNQIEQQVVPAEVQRLGKQSSVNITDGGMPFIQYSKGTPTIRTSKK